MMPNHIKAKAVARNPRALLGMHDGAAVIERRAAMRGVFSRMLARPGATLDEEVAHHVALFELHARNVELFGWRDAEVLRNEAFAEAVEAAPVPVGDAEDSDFGAFDAASR